MRQHIPYKCENDSRVSLSRDNGVTASTPHDRVNHLILVSVGQVLFLPAIL